MEGVTGSIPVAPTNYPSVKATTFRHSQDRHPASTCQNMARTVPNCPIKLGNARAICSADVPGIPIPENGNAVAGVGAHDGAGQKVSRERAGGEDRATRAVLTSALVAVLDREGMVLAVVAGRCAARAFLQGGVA